MGLETVRRQLANVYWQSVPQLDCTEQAGKPTIRLTVVASFRDLTTHA